MKNIYIYLGSKSSAIADYVLLKHPEKFSNEIKYNLAIGRAIKTNWGRKSVAILTNQIKLQSKNEEETKKHLQNVMDKYNVINNDVLLDIKNDIPNQNGYTKLSLTQHITFSNFIDFIRKDNKSPIEIREYIENKTIEDDSEFVAKWLDEAQKQQGFILNNLIAYLNYLESTDLTGRNLVSLSQAYVSHKDFNIARDSFYKYIVLYGEKYGINAWLSYIIGNVNKLSINCAFRLGKYDVQEPHPLLKNDVAINFFQNHEQFIDYYYTDAWKENLAIDFTSRNISKQSFKHQKQEKQLEDVNILFVTNNNWNFLTFLIDKLKQKGLNLDMYDYSYFAKKLSKDKKTLSKFLYTPLHALKNEKNIDIQYLKDNDSVLYSKIQKADIVFCEWGNETAVFLSRFLPPDKKLIIRIHSYEVFTHWHLAINMGGVDGLIFVSPHIRNIFYKNASPLLYNCPDSCMNAVISNVKNFEGYTEYKTDIAKYTLGMAGFNKENKGLLKALKILKHLHDEDSRWSLRLAGEEFIPNSSDDYKYWAEICQPFIYANNLQEVVIFDGYQDMSNWLVNIGFIISVSNREGTHEALLEGVSSGCIPIIIDWSMVKEFGGVKLLYPFLQKYVLADEQDIKMLSTNNIHTYFDLDRINLMSQMRQHSDVEKVSSEIIDFIGRVYEA